MRINEEGWPVTELGDRYKDLVIPCHVSRTLPLDTGEPLGVVWHYDAIHKDVQLAPRLVGAAGDKGASKRNVSWHVQIMRTGKRVWSVPAVRGGRHVGKPGKIRGKVRSANRNLVAVELAGAGHLHRVGDRFYASWKRDKDGVERKALGPDPKTEIPKARVYGGHSGIPAQEAFTDAQEASALELCNALLAGFDLGVADLQYTHEFFDRPRKGDPGAAWCVARLPRILGQCRDSTPEGYNAFTRVKTQIDKLIGKRW